MSSWNGLSVIAEPHSCSTKTTTNHIVSITLFDRECFVCLPSNCTCTSASASRFLAKRFFRRVVFGLSLVLYSSSCVSACARSGRFFSTLVRRLPSSAGVPRVPGRRAGACLDEHLFTFYARGSAGKKWLVHLFSPDSRIYTQTDVIASPS